MRTENTSIVYRLLAVVLLAALLLAPAAAQVAAQDETVDPAIVVLPTPVNDTVQPETEVVHETTARTGEMSTQEGPATDGAAAPESVSGSTVTTGGCYAAGTAMATSFQVYNGSTDTEWLTQVSLTFPTGWTVACGTQDARDSGGNPVSFTCNASGNTVTYSDNDGGYGEIYGTQTWNFSVNVTALSGASGAQTVNWTLTGDNFGGTPHSLASSLQLAQCAAPGVIGTPVQVYYVPLPEQETHNFMQLVSLTGNLGSTQRSIISIVSSDDGTVIYYDHWEDGYETTLPPPSPKQASTGIWGNGLAADGCPPNKNGVTLTCTDANDIIGAGDVIAPQNDVPLPRVVSNILYDGRDKFAATKALAVTRAQWDTYLGTVLGSAVDVYDTSAYGTTFRAPIGESFNSTFDQDAFSATRFFVMAWKDSTSCTLTGQAVTSFSLNEGENYLSPGAVDMGDTLTCDKPVQADLATGDYSAAYHGYGWESRWYSLIPTNLWSTGYYTPVGRANSNYATSVFIYNGNASDITVNWARNGNSGSFAVAANGVTSIDLGDYGYRFYNTSGYKFFAIEAVNLPAYDDLYYDNSTYDWGFTLVPENLASDEILTGWGPGSSNLTANGSPLWVMAVDSGTTTVYVDFDGDPTTGANTDPAGNKYDISYNLAQYASQRIYDNTNSDNDQARAHVYTTTGARIVAAWGEDASTAGSSSPYLDLGTVIRPLPKLLAGKSTELFTDNDGDGQPSLGDVLRYIITIENRGTTSVSGLNLQDTLPAKVSYNSSTTQVSYDNGATWPTSVANSGTTQFPLDEGGYSFPSAPAGAGILPGKTIYQVRFLVTVTSVLDPALIDIKNTATWSWTGGNLYPEVTTPLNQMDWGDLPDGIINSVTYGFPTLLANNGPRHTNSGLHLGATGDANRFDRETNGYGAPSVNADGDDTAQVDDENGVTWLAYNSIRVNVTGDNGCLNAWMDFTNDAGSGVGSTYRDFNFTKTGGWDTYSTYSEWVIQDQPVTAGINPFTLSLPAGVVPSASNTDYYFRFRLSPRNGSNGCTSGAVTDRGLVLGGEVEDYKKIYSPLAVDLAFFSAAAAADGVTLAWETVSETDNAGFNIYRADSSLVADDAGSSGADPLGMTGWVQVNAALIPAATPGSSQGNAYTWTDPTATAAGTYWYRLEDVALDGTLTQHAPVAVTVAAPNAVGLAAFGAAATPSLAGLAALALAALAGVATRKRR